MKNNFFPVQHVSIRVPWHENRWDGSVCKNPAYNTSCLKLKNIAESKDEHIESQYAGKSIENLPMEFFPPCVKERATFMANFSFERLHEHPYAKNGKETHLHFMPTPLYYPAYAAPGLPFRWVMKKFVFGDSREHIPAIVDRFPLENVREEYEPGEKVLGFKSAWLQDYRNHHELLNCFWNHIRPEESLVFLYAKQVPLVEDTGRRVLIGVGRVKSLGNLTEYDYRGDTTGKIRSLMWERMVVHSIRFDMADGFLMPYHEALEKSDEGRAFDPADVVAFAPEDRFDEFSYATEHVGHDAAIDALQSIRAALLRCGELFNYSTTKQEKWIDREMGRLWKKRGPFPGLGSVLQATGLEMGNFIAHYLTERAGERGNPWDEWNAALDNPGSVLPKELARHLDGTIGRSWKRMPNDRRSFLELLSRIDISAEQADILAIPEKRLEVKVNSSDSQFTENPYLFYESTRLSDTPLSITTVDRGVFPTKFIREAFPVPAPSIVDTPVDARRLRALVIRELEQAAIEGDTLLAREAIIQSLRKRDEALNDPGTAVTADLLAVAEEELFSGEIKLVHFADGRPAYQLERFAEVGNLIRSTVSKRASAPRHAIQADWREELDKILNSPVPSSGEEHDKEVRARQEKALALSELAASRITVLIGPAGTGKTTLLSVLCKHPEIQKGGLLLLAPTGKARVRMESLTKQTGIVNYQAYTVAQFLTRSNRYDSITGRYLLTGQPGDKVAHTVIIDECSMFTEEMLAALIESLSGVHRFILVGDSRQLPPIGAGRPFVDIVKYLTPDDIETKFPKVGPGFAELTVPRRQGAGERDDLQLASWFGGAATAPGEDQIFEILAGKRTSPYIEFVQWNTPDDLNRLLPEVLAQTLKFDLETPEWLSFALSLGGQEFKGSPWFSVKSKERPGAGQQAEAWQILSPVRQKPWGVETLNRFIHKKYLGIRIEEARNQNYKLYVPKPMGDAQIIYGDKVINNRNRSMSKRRIYPEPSEKGYLANGEIGIVVGHRWTSFKRWPADYLEIEFSTQLEKVYKFYNSDFNDEGDSGLELAYALTVHKAQGSEFNVVFLVLPKSPLMLTRELIYTALTRQKQKIIVLHQGSATELQQLSSERFSASATRLTNLFFDPKPVEILGKFLENRLIHVSSRGEAVRSKSEVIIADHLHANKIAYLYEHPLEIDGVVKYPDFTIEDDDLGLTYYWEHCGMLHDPSYRRRWEEKKSWYKANGILPLSEGRGTQGTLIETHDEPNGGISSQNILRVIQEVLLNSR